MSFRRRKRGSANQIGQPFPTDDEPLTVQQFGREQTFSRILRETRSHDINTLVDDLVREGKDMSKETEAASRDAAMGQAKMEATRKIIDVLEQMKAQGRTRIGDSELKGLVRTIFKESGLPPSAFTLPT